MNKIVLTLSAVAAVVTCAGSAGAQCEFNAVAKAKGMKASLVRAFAVCPSSYGGVGYVNTSTGGGTPACSPIDPVSTEGDTTPYVFDSHKGRCDVQTKAKIVEDCAVLEDAGGDPLGLPAGPCQVIGIKAKCQGILRTDGATPIDAPLDAGWSLPTLVRWTFNDAASGDVTLIDFPITFAFKDPSNGQIKLDTNSAQALAAILVDVSGAAMPTCASVQILRVGVKDPSGLYFAELGGSTRAAGE
ncbi:MAG: hypothetical protein HY899_05700 [Deltaproteobacteria bacterium]|nr:hypothetical protein [Deltaproteobacteria bacterium]